jgi:predicted RNase H-like HicB family nuclease
VKKPFIPRSTLAALTPERIAGIKKKYLAMLLELTKLLARQAVAEHLALNKKFLAKPEEHRMAKNYIAIVRKEPGTSYGVDFPDFPGCTSGGETLEEAISKSREAIKIHIEGMIADGEMLPLPTDLQAVTLEAEIFPLAFAVLAPF